MEDKRTVHPSFGQIELGRVHSSHPQPFYGSHLKHSDYIRISLYHSTESRNLSKEWYYNKGLIAEIHMTQNQFAEFVTSAGMGGGVPCTISFIEGEGRIDPPADLDRTDEFKSEFRDSIEESVDYLDKTIKMVRDLMESKKNLTKKDKEDLLTMLQMSRQSIASNAPFVQNMFMEHIDKVVTEAKATIEAWALGQHLAGKSIPSFHGEAIEENTTTGEE